MSLLTRNSILFNITWILCNLLSLAHAASDNLSIATPPPSDNELYHLDNQTLIDQASRLFNEALKRNRIRVRVFRHNETALELAQRTTSALRLPSPLKKKKETPLQQAERALAYVKVYIEGLQHRLEALQAEQALQEIHHTQATEVQTSLQAIIDTLQQLEKFAFETQLRIKDGTLAARKQPSLLRKQQLQKNRRKYQKQREQWRKRKDNIQQQQEQLRAKIEKTQQDITTYQHQKVQHSEQYNRELKRQTLHKKYANQASDRSIQQLISLQAERAWFDGAFNLAQHDFKKSQAATTTSQQAITALTAPEEKKNVQKPLHSIDEAQQAKEQMKAAIQYQSKKQQLLDQLQVALKTLITHSQELENKATVLAEHLFQMEVLANTIKKFDTIPEKARAKQLTASNAIISKANSDAYTSRQNAQTQLQEITTQKKQIGSTLTEARHQLALAEKRISTLKQEQALEEQLKTLNAEQLLERFQANTKELQYHEKQRNTSQAALQKAHAITTEAEQQFLELDGPFLRVAQQELRQEKQSIITMLSEWADLKPTGFKLDQVPPSKAEKNSQPKMDALSHLVPIQEEQQNLLSSRTHALTEQLAQQKGFVQALQKEKKVLDLHIQNLQETMQRLRLNHAGAIEIQKRLGRSELSNEQIPNGLTDALQQKRLLALKEELNRQLTAQTYLQRQIKTWDKPIPHHKQWLENLEGMLSLVGRRIDEMVVQDKHQQAFLRERDSFSDTEHKALEQFALRRLTLAQSIGESLLRFFPSERAAVLTDLLRDYYQDLIVLERQQNHLQEQRKGVQLLIDLVEQEKATIEKILPLISEQTSYFKEAKKTALVQTQSRLQPEQAAQLIQKFTKQTGRNLDTPIPLLAELKENFVQDAAAHIFRWHLQIQANQKWQTLFQSRLLKGELDDEINLYRDTLSALDAKSHSLQRQIHHLQGDITPPIDATSASSPSKAKGEIGLTRVERYQLWQQAAIWIVIKLFTIMVVALMLNWLVKRVIRGLIKRAQDHGRSNQATVLLPFLRISLIILLWIIAIIISLSILGINVGAIMAGLGIGGLAIAMALKNTLSDLIAGINIILTRAFKVGDRIRFTDKEATVQQIGLRYTQLKDFSYNHILTVPNSLLVEAGITNTTGHPGFAILTNIALSIRNNADKIHKAITIVKDTVNDHKEASFIWAKHDHFNDHAFVLRIHYDINLFKDRARVETDINVALVKQFQKHGIEFADMPYSKV